MASRGKRSSAYQGRNIKPVAIRSNSESEFNFDVAETTPIGIVAAPCDGRGLGIAYVVIEAVDGTPTITVANATTGASTTAVLATGSAAATVYKALAAELPFSRGDKITLTSDGNGSTGKLAADLIYADETV